MRQRQLLDDAEAETLDEATRLRRAREARSVHLRARGDGTVQVVVTLLADEAQRVFNAVETLRDTMREECPSLPPALADAFVRLIDTGFEEATVEAARRDFAEARVTFLPEEVAGWHRLPELDASEDFEWSSRESASTSNDSAESRARTIDSVDGDSENAGSVGSRPANDDSAESHAPDPSRRTRANPGPWPYVPPHARRSRAATPSA